MIHSFWSSVQDGKEEQDAVTQNDLEHLLHLLKGKDGVMDWHCFMDRSTPNMSYQAWRHEPEVGSEFQCLSHLFPLYDQM